MKRKIANQISIPVIIVSALALFLIVVVSDILINRIINEQIDIQIENASDNFYGNLNRLANRTAQVSTALSINPEIISTFKEFNETDDFDISVEKLKSIMERLNTTMLSAGFSNMRFQFHTKDIRSLYRTWTSKKGDDVSYRESIVKCIKEKKYLRGIEAGKGGIAIRSIVPVLDENSNVVGSFENFVDMSEFMNILSCDTTHENYTIFISPEYAKLIDSEISKSIETNKVMIGGFLLNSSSCETFKSGLLTESQLSMGLSKSTIVNIDDFIFSINPIFDYDQRPIGVFVYEYNQKNFKKAISSLRAIYISIGVVLFLVIFSIITFLVQKIVGRPIRNIREHMKQVEEGRLNQSIAIESNNEIGDVLTSLKQMIENLKKIILNIAEESARIESSSNEMSKATNDISNGATEQAASLEEISSSVEQISSNIMQNAENSKQTEKIASNAAVGIVKGNEASQHVVTSMNIIAEKISIINDIAFQTNILALNAAVEAARAGEHGKGFAVVASEVRKLAERSKIAADEIAQITADGVAQTKEAGIKLGEIAPEIEKTARLVQEISAASNEMSSGTDQVNTSIQQLNQVTQQNASAAEELASTAEELANQAERLNKVIAFFDL